MTRPKTITDEELLTVARKLFRAHGHHVSTRQVAEAAGISEGVLYQRFRNKDELFFAAMAPSPVDLTDVLGPVHPEGEGPAVLRAVAAGLTAYFADILPIGLRLMTHPSFHAHVAQRAHSAPATLIEGVTERFAWLEKQGKLRRGAATDAARIVVALAHDAALHTVMVHGSAKSLPDLTPALDLLWRGAAPAATGGSKRARRA